MSTSANDGTGEAKVRIIGAPKCVDLQKAAICEYKAKERERIAMEKLRQRKKEKCSATQRARVATSISSVAGMQQILLRHNLEAQEERRKRLASIGVKTLNDILRGHSNVDDLRTHIRRKLVALSYGCLDIRAFYRRLFASFDNENDKKLSLAEVENVLRKYCNVTRDDVRTVLALMDTDDTGDIDFDEFFDFLEIKNSKASINVRNVPITPRSKIDWCLNHIKNQSDLTFALHMLKGLADKQPPLCFLKRGAIVTLWNVVLQYTIQNAKADLELEGEQEAINAARALGNDVSMEDMRRRNSLMRVHSIKTSLSPSKAGGGVGVMGAMGGVKKDGASTTDAKATKGKAFPSLEGEDPDEYRNEADMRDCQITLDQRDTAIETLEHFSNCFAVLSRKLRTIPLPDPEQLVFELHVRSVHIAKHHVKGTSEDEDFFDDDDDAETSSLSLEERLEAMRAKVEATRQQVREDKIRKEQEEEEAADAGENKIKNREIIEQLIDEEEVLFLLRCISVQINKLDEIRLLELLECVLLMIGEGKHHEVMGLTKAHRLVAQSILAHYRSDEVMALLKALKQSHKNDYICRVIIKTAKKVIKGMRQQEVVAAKWDNKKKEETKRQKTKALEKKRKIKILEKMRRKTLSDVAQKAEKRKQQAERQRLRDETKQEEKKEQRRKRAAELKKRMKAHHKAKKKIGKLKQNREKLELMHQEQEREEKNQEAVREWRRAKVEKERQKQTKQRQYAARHRRKSRKRRKKKSNYISYVRLPNIRSPAGPAIAKESYAKATASYQSGSSRAGGAFQQTKSYVSSLDVRKNAEMMLKKGQFLNTGMKQQQCMDRKTTSR